MGNRYKNNDYFYDDYNNNDYFYNDYKSNDLSVSDRLLASNITLTIR